VIADLHNHYLRAGEVDAMVEAAARAGVAEVAITEHVFHLTEAREASTYLRTRFVPEGTPLPHAEYVAAVAAAAARASIPVRVGVELDVRPEDEELAATTARLRTELGAIWDVVIGSVHVIDEDRDIHLLDDARLPDAIWADYVGRLRHLVASGLYDVVSHPVRLGTSLPGVPATVPALLDDLARDAARHDCPLEINGTDHRRRPDLVRLLVISCARYKAPVALGSDAHRPGRAGCVVDTLPLLRELRVGSAANFVRRVRADLPL